MPWAHRCTGSELWGTCAPPTTHVLYAHHTTGEGSSGLQRVGELVGGAISIFPKPFFFFFGGGGDLVWLRIIDSSCLLAGW